MKTAGRICVLVALLWVVGCQPGPTFVRSDQQITIDRSVVDYPPNLELKVFAENLNCPTGFAMDREGTMFIVEGGLDGIPPHIFGRRTDGSIIEIYPAPQKVHVPFIGQRFHIYGPIGGIAVVNDVESDNRKVFVSHRDKNDKGVITAFGFDGSHSTVTSEFPAQGDYGLTDIAINPQDRRLWFGVGAATNSGVVGIDNWQEGWLRKHPYVSDIPYTDLKLYGLKFYSKNPMAGWFGGNDLAVTGPFQAFGTSDKTRIKRAAGSSVSSTGKANSAVYSISQSGGDARMECHGIRMPRGLGFSQYGVPYVTNNGMEMRGTRPIKDDPDAFVLIKRGSWFGFPDYSTDLMPIANERFQPPSWLVIKSGYPDINPLIDKEVSTPPLRIADHDSIKGMFPSFAGAAKFDFLPSTGPLKSDKLSAVVALFGDRAPFATSGQPLTGTPGYKVVRVSVDDQNQTPMDYVYNTRGLPASKLGRGVVALERPCDVKMGVAGDNSLYILDMGQMVMKDGKGKIASRTGRIFRLVPVESRPTSQSR